MQEGEQADTSQQGGKAPKNPITGEPLTPVTNKGKEGYQATVLAGQSDETSARIMKQLGGQDGRPLGGGQWLLLSHCSSQVVLRPYAFHNACPQAKQPVHSSMNNRSESHCALHYWPVT
jgi:hypothetical protein